MKLSIRIEGLESRDKKHFDKFCSDLLKRKKEVKWQLTPKGVVLDGDKESLLGILSQLDENSLLVKAESGVIVNFD